MIDTAIGSRNDVTVVLLGEDQAHSRVRAQHYYQQAQVPCVAFDLPPGSSSAGFVQALAECLAGLATAYVVLALDTDFVLASSLDNAAACLHAQPGVVAAQGQLLGYRPASGKVEYYRVGSAFAPALAETATARLLQYAQSGQQAWRAVMRVSTLQAVLMALPDSLDAPAVRVAMSLAVLAQGPVAHLAQTDVVSEHEPAGYSPVEREERLTQLVRGLRQWDAELYRLCGDEQGFTALNRFVRSTYDLSAASLIFTSSWRSVIDDPERLFEPHQDVQLPYYNGALFARLTELEFLCHAWPTSPQQQRALEGIWVQQRDLLQAHPNDTAESLSHRYWQALALSLFNREVCHLLLSTLDRAEEAAHVRELTDWLARLEQVPGIHEQCRLQGTPSGQVIDAIAAATPDEAGRQRVLRYLAKHPAEQIAFVVLDLENDDQALQATFDSLLASGIRNFKLLVLKAGKPPAITTPRDTLHFIQVSDSNWVNHLNQAVRQLPSAWLMLLSAGDVLLAGGLLRLSVELVDAPACHAIAANEVQRDSQGRLHSVERPGADLDLLRSQPGLMSRHWLVRRQAVLDLGGYSETCREALELDLLLRLVEAQGLSSLAHMADYLVIGEQGGSALDEEAAKVVGRHLTQLGYRAQVKIQANEGLSIDYRHSSTPLVSVLVASEGDASQLQACLRSVLQRTRYPRYEVLVVCAEHEVAALQPFAGKVHVLVGQPGGSRSQWLNLAASQARGAYLVLVSERSQVITPAWIEALLNEAQRPEVGVVGACLEGGDTALLHAGYALLQGPQVASPWQGMKPLASAEARWPLAVRGCQAVSADCLMVSKEVFEHRAGLQVAQGADIDLCRAVVEAGQLVVWTPQARLLLSALPEADRALVQALFDRWPSAFSEQAASSLGWLEQVE
jgi:hypothetical protein